MVQKNKQSMDIGSEVGYHLIITRVSPEEMKKDVNENSTYTPSGKKALNGDAETSAGYTNYPPVMILLILKIIKIQRASLLSKYPVPV